MRIGLVDVDGHNFPNVALMKISAYHKSNSDNVEWLNPLLQYDKAYLSKIFDFTADFDTCINAKEISKGGRAYDKKKVLPREIETMYPDYSLYNITNKAYGYLTRGCPRNCPFCDVANIEGTKARKVANLNQFWNGQKEIVLLDPNLLAVKDRKELLQQLIDSKAWVDFTQGLDARLLTEDVTEMIMQIKVKMLHFAWDLMKYSDIIFENLMTFKKVTQIDYRKLRVYVLSNYNTTIDEDLYRVYKLKEIGYDPFIMLYNKDGASRQHKRMARWVNNKFIFRTCEKFENYKAN
jgi:hypothetical protein